MKENDIDSWIVMEGKLVYSCKTRKQARAYIKKNKTQLRQFVYVGKCRRNYRIIELDT